MAHKMGIPSFSSRIHTIQAKATTNKRTKTSAQQKRLNNMQPSPELAALFGVIYAPKKGNK